MTFSVYESLFERTAWPRATVKQSKFSKVKNNAFSTKRFGRKKEKKRKEGEEHDTFDTFALAFTLHAIDLLDLPRLETA